MSFHCFPNTLAHRWCVHIIHRYRAIVIIVFSTTAPKTKFKTSVCNTLSKRYCIIGKRVLWSRRLNLYCLEGTFKVRPTAVIPRVRFGWRKCFCLAEKVYIFLYTVDSCDDDPFSMGSFTAISVDIELGLGTLILWSMVSKCCPSEHRRLKLRMFRKYCKRAKRAKSLTIYQNIYILYIWYRAL